MRLQPTPVVAAALAVWVLCGCARKQPAEPPEPSATSAPVPAPQPRALTTPDAGAPQSARDAGVAEAGAPAAAPDKALDGPLQKFSGFSGDETNYAFAIYSDGAGFFLLNVVDGGAGKIVQRFQLSDEANVEKAREYLKAHGYTSRTRPPSAPPANRATAAVKQGQVEVTVAPEGGGAPRVLYRGDPFNAQGGVGAPSNAAVAGASPSGRKLLVKVDQEPVTEFGGITTYLVLDLEGQR